MRSAGREGEGGRGGEGEREVSVRSLVRPLLLLPSCLKANSQRSCTGRRCIWDLRLSTKSGWRLRPSSSVRGRMCFERFENGHRDCDEWWYQRPRFDL